MGVYGLLAFSFFSGTTAVIRGREMVCLVGGGGQNCGEIAAEIAGCTRDIFCVFPGRLYRRIISCNQCPALVAQQAPGWYLPHLGSLD